MPSKAAVFAKLLRITQEPQRSRGSRDAPERCRLLLRGHLTCFWLARKAAWVSHSFCAGPRTDPNYLLLLNWPEGTFGGGLCWSVCGFLSEDGWREPPRTAPRLSKHLTKLLIVFSVSDVG